MWSWFLGNDIWILVASSAVVVVLLLFNKAIRRFVSLEFGEAEHARLHVAVNIVFWVVEAAAGVCMAVSFLTLATTPNLDTGSGNVTAAVPAVNSAAIKHWFVDHGFRMLLYFIVGIVLWIVSRETIPSFTERVVGRPKRGESREGIKRRAATLEGVFLGLSRIVIITLVGFLILAELNVNIGPVLAGLGVAGVAVGFGAQYLVRDLIAGVFIILENQYRVGDVAKVADVTGQVEDINLRRTVLRDLDGIVHYVPNGEIRVASNYSRHFARVNLDIPVSYGTDLNHAIEVINKVCEDLYEDAEWKPLFRTKPQVLRVNNLGDSGIDLKITGDVKSLEQWRITGELRLRIKNEFDRVGIEIPWPHTKVYFGNKPGDA